MVSSLIFKIWRTPRKGISQKLDDIRKSFVNCNIDIIQYKDVFDWLKCVALTRLSTAEKRGNFLPFLASISLRIFTNYSLLINKI